LAKLAVDLGANRFPDTSMSCPVAFMVGVWVMFGVVIGPVFGSSIPAVLKLVLRCTASKPPEAHIHHFGIGDFGCGHPIAMRVCLWGIISRAVTKRAASSDLEAEALQVGLEP
jgi:hypothetical protein